MKNIGILSMQKIDNYGSVLQSYGLKKMLESLGATVFFVDIEKRDEDNKLLGSVINDFRNECDKGGFHFSKVNKYIWIRVKHRIEARHCINYFDIFRDKYLNIDDKREKYDLCVIGSDEVFNCLNPEWWGFTSQLFGDVVNANKVITYAASCGATKFEQLPNGVVERIRQAFVNVSGFSVRDKNTKVFVSKIADVNISENFDPVLVYDFKKEIEETKLLDLPKKYCVIYAYNNRIREKREIDKIIKFCKRRKLIPISLCGEQFWCKKHINCSPFECLKVFQEAEFVITDTFHGTIFSAKYSKRFGVIIRESNRNKLGDLVDRLNINDHVLSDTLNLEEVYELGKREMDINNILNLQRKKTIQYLQEYINE